MLEKLGSEKRISRHRAISEYLSDNPKDLDALENSGLVRVTYNRFPSQMKYSEHTKGLEDDVEDIWVFTHVAPLRLRVCVEV